MLESAETRYYNQVKMAPASDLKSACKHSGTPLRGTNAHEDASDKATLLSALHLVPQPSIRRVEAVKKTLLPIELGNRLVAKRGEVVSYFKSNPLPISSTLGRKIIRSGYGRCPDPAAQVARYDKYCSTHEHKCQPAGETHWPVVSTRRAVLKRGQYCHKYTFGTRQRVTRNVELTLGVSAKSFPMLNKCRGFSIQGHKMSDQDIAQAIRNLRNPAQGEDSGTAPTESSLPVRCWIASERTAGPSRGVERIAELVVLLDDRNLALLHARLIS